MKTLSKQRDQCIGIQYLNFRIRNLFADELSDSVADLDVDVDLAVVEHDHTHVTSVVFIDNTCTKYSILEELQLVN